MPSRLLSFLFWRNPFALLSNLALIWVFFGAKWLCFAVSTQFVCCVHSNKTLSQLPRSPIPEQTANIWGLVSSSRKACVAIINAIWRIMSVFLARIFQWSDWPYMLADKKHVLFMSYSGNLTTLRGFYRVLHQCTLIHRDTNLFVLTNTVTTD